MNPIIGNMILIIEKIKGKKFVDDLTGQVLDERLVNKARRLEMEYFKQKDVYTKVPRSEAMRRTGRQPIGVRWVDVNKGDDEEHICVVEALEIYEGWARERFSGARMFDPLFAFDDDVSLGTLEACLAQVGCDEALVADAASGALDPAAPRDTITDFFAQRP